MIMCECRSWRSLAQQDMANACSCVRGNEAAVQRARFYPDGENKIRSKTHAGESTGTSSLVVVTHSLPTASRALRTP